MTSWKENKATEASVITPGAVDKEQMATMFDSIAGKYDFLNHFLSLGIDKCWRRRVVRIIKKQTPAQLLDVATGTGDLAIAIQRRIKPEKIIGVDISEQMLEVGREKLKKKGLENTITLTYGDSENLQFPDNSFDAVTVAFGARNFEHLDKGLEEIFRVLKPGGLFVCLEFTMPRRFPFKQLYKFYFKYILPIFGRLVSGSSYAYTYLPDSVQTFPQYDMFIERLTGTKFVTPSYKPLTFGIATIYTATK